MSGGSRQGKNMSEVENDPIQDTESNEFSEFLKTFMQ
jgi:hypothetical protein